jgi:hypothetical protein
MKGFSHACGGNDKKENATADPRLKMEKTKR